MTDSREPSTDPSAALRERVLARRPPGADLWVFAYASLIWRPGFDCAEQRPARLNGYHRALKMWSHVNRGTPERPGLVFALLPGGSCTGRVLRLPAATLDETFDTLWRREMPRLTYAPRWLRCATPHGPVHALAFTLPRGSAGHAGTLSAERYRDIFATAHGACGSTLDYARRTHECLLGLGIHDRSLGQLLQLAEGLPMAGAAAPRPPSSPPASIPAGPTPAAHLPEAAATDLSTASHHP